MPDTSFIREVGFSRWAGWTAKRQFAKRVLNRDLSLRLPTGRTMLIPRDSQSAGEVFLTNADMDWGSEQLFARFAEGDFIDAGAHVGYYSLYLSPLVERVYAFEPDPRCFGALSVNIAAARNAVHVPKALSNQHGFAKLDVSRASALSTLSDDGSLSVETVTIDEFVSGIDKPNIKLIKTDVEGHDLSVLQGAAGTLRRFQPLVLSEITGGAVEAFATELGFSVYAFDRQRRLGPAPTDGSKMVFLVPPRLAEAFNAQSRV
jgi:FkbM family methyltransferase